MKGEAVAKDCEMAMGIKKVFMSVLLLGILMLSGICYAEIKESDLNIGGIYCGQPIGDVIAKYGQPVEKRPGAPKGMIYTFISNGQKIRVSDKGEVSGVSVSGNGDIATKAGIKVGSTLEDVVKIYGTPSYDYSSNSYSPLRNIGYKTYAPTSWGGKYELTLGFSLDANNKVDSFSFAKEVWTP